MAALLISRGTTSGGDLLAQCLTHTARLSCVTREDLVTAVNRHGGLATRITAEIDHAAQDNGRFSELRRPYKILMRQALLEYARQGDLAYLGYSRHLLVEELAAFFRVRLVASLDLRIRFTMGRLGCDEPTARNHVRQADEQRARWARFMYGRNIRDPEHYDLCVNLDRMSIPAVCSLLQRTMEEPEVQSTPESAAELDQALVATSVLAALATDPETVQLEMGATADGGRVRLEGPYLDEPARRRVLDIARSPAWPTWTTSRDTPRRSSSRPERRRHWPRADRVRWIMTEVQQAAGTLDRIEGVLEQSLGLERTRVELIQEQNLLARRRTEGTAGLLELSSSTARHTEQQTEMARERTAHTREQTRLSTRSTELGNIRTDLSRERTALAEQRTDLAVRRSEMARHRTSLAEGRNRMSDERTHLATERTDLARHRTGLSSERTDLARARNGLAEGRTAQARTRTRLSLVRTELARGRTYLAVVRTGFAFFTIGLTLFRYFGPSWWTLFDVSLVVFSVGLVAWGVAGYRRSQREEARIVARLTADPELTQVLV